MFKKPDKVHPGDLQGYVMHDGEKVPHLLDAASLEAFKEMEAGQKVVHSAEARQTKEVDEGVAEPSGHKRGRKDNPDQPFSYLFDRTGKGFVLYQGKSDYDAYISSTTDEEEQKRLAERLKARRGLDRATVIAQDAAETKSEMEKRFLGQGALSQATFAQDKAGSERVSEERALGEGAFGRVKLAQDAQGAWYAVKIIQDDGDGTKPLLQEAVNDEMRAMKALDLYVGDLITTKSEEEKSGWMHDVVAAPWLDDEDDGAGLLPGQDIDESYKHYLIMPLIPGKPLSQLIEEGLPEERVYDIFLKIVTQLDTLHRAGFIHRDLKPQNIIVDPETWEVRIIDLGMVKRVDSKTGQYSGMPDQGTSRYMAPEIFSGTTALIEGTVEYSKGSDFFALGRIAIEMLMGSKAKEVYDDAPTLMAAIQTKDREIKKEYDREVSRWLNLKAKWEKSHDESQPFPDTAPPSRPNPLREQYGMDSEFVSTLVNAYLQDKFMAQATEEQRRDPLFLLGIGLLDPKPTKRYAAYAGGWQALLQSKSMEPSSGYASSSSDGRATSPTFVHGRPMHKPSLGAPETDSAPAEQQKRPKME